MGAPGEVVFLLECEMGGEDLSKGCGDGRAGNAADLSGGVWDAKREHRLWGEHRKVSKPRGREAIRAGTVWVLLVASRLVPENNADLVVRAFEKVKTPRLLAIAGNANYRSAFVDRLKETKDTRVKFLVTCGTRSM